MQPSRDTPDDHERARDQWRAARTFDELCELGARFVEGQLPFFPGWNAPDLDVESDEIASRLAHLCRLGFLTLASQPARAEQRAFVAGFVSRQAAERLSQSGRSSQLVVAVFGLGPFASSVEPVSLHDGVAHAFAGHDAREAELECFEDCIAPEALDALRRCCYVSAFDPEWGRADRLWRELERVMEDA